MEDVLKLSLDEIIERKKQNGKAKPGNAGAKPKASAPPTKGLGPRRVSVASERSKLVDARLKIIEKKRAKIIDARDRLIEKARAGGDARQRLLRKGLARGAGEAGFAPVTSGNGVHKGQHQSRQQQHHHRTMGGTNRGRVLDGYGSTLDDELESMSIDDDDSSGLTRGGQRRVVPASSLQRTLSNDSFNVRVSMPPLPTFRTVRQSSPPTSPSFAGWMSDPFECYEPIRRPQHLQTVNTSSRSPPPSRSVRSLGRGHPPYDPAAVQPRSSIPSTTTSRSSYSPLPGRGGGGSFEMPLPEMLSSSMRNRLERAPNPAESMGIFAHLQPNEPIPPYNTYATTYRAGSSYGVRAASPSRATAAAAAAAAPPAATGYRIIVSNLHENVTHQDIKELFEDIGDLLESRLVRKGVAEVIYRSLRDAEKAVDAYHNRQLDGQPMNCLLVPPRSQNKPISSAIKYGSGTTQASVVAGRAASVKTSGAAVQPNKRIPTSSSSNNNGGSSGSGGGPGRTSKADGTMEIDVDAVHTVLFRHKY